MTATRLANIESRAPSFYFTDSGKCKIGFTPDIPEGTGVFMDGEKFACWNPLPWSHFCPYWYLPRFLADPDSRKQRHTIELRYPHGFYVVWNGTRLIPAGSPGATRDPSFRWDCQASNENLLRARLVAHHNGTATLEIGLTSGRVAWRRLLVEDSLYAPDVSTSAGPPSIVRIMWFSVMLGIYVQILTLTLTLTLMTQAAWRHRSGN
ncbi:hypothetical protein PAPYR_8278 [Paratrimastix pyriformis]|uniref:Uncharacterized protein n=1 Tax=Paratrimastix pyriformis TaxID=342808 RepID=A0ABQ8UDL2_9EUKA|nr:hypothetical protein PAPYR_8278 [Paratrimastix pyriformis]